MENVERKELFGHPVGLFVLFFTEMWERFSYYGMRALLTLYMYTSITGDKEKYPDIANFNPGLGWDEAFALSIYGWYTMAVYVMSIPGGILADKWLGQKKTVMLGGLLLCLGHGVLAVDAEWAFVTGLVLIVLGVGGLKPNISTMVGGLYKEGDVRRDPGFTIFYIGINVGAFLAALVVGGIGETYGWHYGFGLAGIGMLLGQAVFIWGQKHLKGVGESLAEKKGSGVDTKAPLTKVEKDRMIVLLLSFLIIIVFWGAFEQAGGLMNIYTNEKVDRVLFGWTMPTSWFQAFNPGYIMIFGTIVAGFWVKRQLKGKESSTLFKMAVGTIIMGLGFLMMSGASMQASSAESGKAAMYWLFGAYLLHTIGELCASPTALSFITKLAPAKYASIMMGVYFAATGFGNKLAGTIGEASQSEPIEIECIVDNSQLSAIAADSILNENGAFNISSTLKKTDGKVELIDENSNSNISSLFSIDEEVSQRIDNDLSTIDAQDSYSASLEMEFDKEKSQYVASFVVDEVQSEREFNTFTLVFVFTVVFGLLLMLFLKKLKALTHGAEDINDTHHEETEGFELADKE